MNIIFAIPKAPNFNKIAANKIDPIVGASTCALGNQICKKNKGNFTKNIEKIQITKIKFNFRNIIFSILKKFICKIQKMKIEGILKNNVYPKRNELAWIRSIWYPQKEINIKIGIIENSNII